MAAASGGVLITALCAGNPAQAQGGHTGATLFEPGSISLPDKQEYRITFTPDGRTAYFSRADKPFPVEKKATIMVTHKRHGRWAPPVVAPFSGRYGDMDPFITHDGSKMFFSSTRPVTGETARPDTDTWVMKRRRDGGWGKPRHLGDAVNSPADELYPSVTRRGTLYVARHRPEAGPIGDWDIYRSRPRKGGEYGRLVSVGAPINNDAKWQFNPLVTADEKVMFFASANFVERENIDIYASFRVRGRWSNPRKLGPDVNTSGDEYHPSLSPRGDRFFFIRYIYEPDATGDFYSLPIAKIR